MEHILPLVGHVDAEDELVACLLEGDTNGGAQQLQKFASQLVLGGALDDAATLLVHARAVCVLARVHLADECGEGRDPLKRKALSQGRDTLAPPENFRPHKVDVAPRLFLDLVHAVRRKAVPGDPGWSRVVTVLFRFAAAYWTRISLRFSAEAALDLMELLFAGWVEPAKVMLCDVAVTSAAAACLQALAAYHFQAEPYATSCREILAGAVLQRCDGDPELRRAGVVAMRRWLATASPRHCEELARELLSRALRPASAAGQSRDERERASLVLLAGLCACGAAGCLVPTAADSRCAVCEHDSEQTSRIDSAGTSFVSLFNSSFASHFFVLPPFPIRLTTAVGSLESTSHKRIKIAPWAALFSAAPAADLPRALTVVALGAISRIIAHASATELEEMAGSLPAVFELARHPELEVRSAFVRLVPAFCKHLPRLVEPLVKTLSSRLIESEPPVCRTSLAALAQVAMHESAQSHWFFPALYALVGAFHHPDYEVRAMAYNGVHNVARAHGLTEPQLFERHQHDIYTIIVGRLKKEPALLDEVAQYLDVTPFELLKQTLPIWLPKLVASEATDVLTEVCIRWTQRIL